MLITILGANLRHSLSGHRSIVSIISFVVQLSGSSPLALLDVLWPTNKRNKFGSMFTTYSSDLKIATRR